MKIATKTNISDLSPESSRDQSIGTPGVMRSGLRPYLIRDLALLALGFGILYFSMLGLRPLANPDEGRYTEIPREMLESGDFVTPRLNGVKYFEKPALVYWVTALGIQMFGLNEFGARFWCAAFAIGGIVMTYLFARSAYGRGTAIWASLALGTSLLYMGLSQIVLLDMVVSVLISGVLLSFLAATEEEAGSHKNRLLYLFYGFMALATLAKGLIGLALPAAVVGIWIVLGNRWKDLGSYRIFTGLLVFLAIAAPWHIAVAVENADFLNFYFVHEHFLRYTTQIHSRVEPWWFFVPVVLGGFFPWVVFLPQALKGCFGKGLSSLVRDRVTSFLLVWIGFIVFFFSISQSKLIPYVLPVFPALAILIGRYLATCTKGADRKSVLRSIWIYVGISWLLAIFFMVVALPEKYADHITAVNGWRVGLFAILASTSLATFLFIRAWKVNGALISMAVGSAGLFLGLVSLYGLLESKSTKPIAEHITTHLDPEAELFCLDEYFQDLPVYLNRQVKVVDYEGELSFGIHSEPERVSDQYLSKEAFALRWRSEGKRYAVIKKRDLSSWADELGTDPNVLETTRRYLLVGNYAKEEGNL